LKTENGIIKADPIVDAGVVEIEYENVLIDRERIRELLADKGYTLLP